MTVADVQKRVAEIELLGLQAEARVALMNNLRADALLAIAEKKCDSAEDVAAAVMGVEAEDGR